MMGTSRVAAALMTAMLLAQPALAQPTEKQKQQAGDLIKQAIAKSQAKNHEAAIELYQKAYELVGMPFLLSNIGTEYQSAEKPADALKYFCMYLDKEPSGNLAEYATTQAKGAQFQLSGKSVADEDVCKPIEAPADAPVSGTTLPGTDKPPTAPEPRGGGMKIAGLVLGGLGLVGVGTGVYFGLEAQAISDDITNHTDTSVPWRDDIKDYEAKGQRYENLQIAFLAVGGALVVGGAVVYVLGRSKASSTERIAITPTASAESAGVMFSGSW